MAKPKAMAHATLRIRPEQVSKNESIQQKPEAIETAIQSFNLTFCIPPVFQPAFKPVLDLPLNLHLDLPLNLH
jgi:hypothetical protein